MSHLESVTAADLREVLEEVEGKRATKRVIVGINYKHGVSQTDLAEWYGVSRMTIYNWLSRLDRLADEPPEEVVYDAPRSGRPPKLTDEECGRLYAAIRRSPEESGIEAENWTPTVVEAYIEAEFGVEYSTRHVRELMHEAGVSW